MSIRQLVVDDYNKGYINLLSQLTEVGNISKKQFEAAFKNMNSIIFVIEDDGKIIATISVLIEQKFIHECKSVAHIEDVVVDKKYRGLGYASILLQHVIKYIADLDKCYKIILDCDEKLEDFYYKNGFSKKGIQMSYYF